MPVTTDARHISQLAFAGMRWKFYSTLYLAVSQFVFGIALARLLPPADFGIYGYAMIFVGFISIYAQAGIAPAIVQRQQLTPEHIRVAFTLSLLIGLGATVLLWVLAPALTEGLNIPVLRVLSLTFLVAGIGSVSGALLEKEVNFKSLFWVDAFSALLGQGLVSISLALAGLGVWSLVLGILLHSLIRNVALVAICPQHLGFSLSLSRARELMHFGVGMSLSRLALYGAENGGYFVIGRFLPPAALGLYARAYQLARVPAGQFAYLVTSVLFPIYSMVQDDKGRLRKGFYLSISLVALATLPSMVCLALASAKLIPLIYGPAWMGSIHSLQILCVSAALMSVYTLGDTISRAKGLVYAKLLRNGVHALIVITGSMLALPYGIEGMAVAAAIAAVAMYVMVMQLGKKIVDGSWRDVLRSHVPGALMGIVTAGVCSLGLSVAHLFNLPDLWALLILTVCFLSAYIFVFPILPPGCLGDIPKFLIDNCSSSLPPWFLAILSRRWRLQPVDPLRS